MMAESTQNKARAELNFVLEREMSGYRFVSGILTPISDKIETDGIEAAMAAAEGAGLSGARMNLAAALELLGKRPTPDYRNACKEAISAVESAAKLISGDLA